MSNCPICGGFLIIKDLEMTIKEGSFVVKDVLYCRPCEEGFLDNKNSKEFEEKAKELKKGKQ